ncbi:hypothetical protein [Microbulbifer yueqingensis]|uniref:Uncharacterized protein n=1 Tax=Microbulbifer yueqingensis TaxID=658219 RepID=A0A1G8X223_9GAMM|nr:hypothetical protein [Microbulbifer yueqingensis]SDJ84698.1 hypothetical protein SAMN05216212_0937 [Microbulbifer yueqingensis]
MARRIYFASDQLLVSHLYTLLEKAGISALTQQAAVDVPQDESAPVAWYSELWIMRDGQLANAQALLQRALEGERSEPPYNPQVLPDLEALAGARA